MPRIDSRTQEKNKRNRQIHRGGIHQKTTTCAININGSCRAVPDTNGENTNAVIKQRYGPMQSTSGGVHFVTGAAYRRRSTLLMPSRPKRPKTASKSHRNTPLDTTSTPQASMSPRDEGPDEETNGHACWCPLNQRDPAMPLIDNSLPRENHRKEKSKTKQAYQPGGHNKRERHMLSTAQGPPGAKPATNGGTHTRTAKQPMQPTSGGAHPRCQIGHTDRCSPRSAGHTFKNS